MSNIVTCHNCGTRAKAPDAALGKTLACPKCKTPVSVPAAGSGIQSPPDLPRPANGGASGPSRPKARYPALRFLEVVYRMLAFMFIGVGLVVGAVLTAKVDLGYGLGMIIGGLLGGICLVAFAESIRLGMDIASVLYEIRDRLPPRP